MLSCRGLGTNESVTEGDWERVGAWSGGSGTESDDVGGDTACVVLKGTGDDTAAEDGQGPSL